MIRMVMAAAMAAVFALPASAQTIHLGFYELTKESPDHNGIRMAFVSTNGVWSAMPQTFSGARLPDLEKAGALYPETVSLRLGAQLVEARTEKPRYFSRLGLYQPASSIPATALSPAAERDFPGWIGPLAYRPLPLSSIERGPLPPVTPPPASLTASLRDQILADLRARQPDYPFCDQPERFKENRVWRDADIVFSELKGVGPDAVVSAGLPVSFDACQGTNAIPMERDGVIRCSFCMRNYAIAGDRAVYLGAGLSFVGTGDHNGDGKVEHVFRYSAYNRNGYYLFDGSMAATPVRYTWSYH
jgi:hypothetical protein